jgi:hypothetical protein
MSRKVAKLAKKGQIIEKRLKGFLGVLCGSVWPSSWPLRETPFGYDFSGFGLSVLGFRN